MLKCHEVEFSGLPRDSQAAIDAVLESPCTRYWLVNALGALATKDPVDAMCDAEVLCALMQARCQESLNSKVGGTS